MSVAMTPQDPSVRKQAAQPALPFAQAPPAAPATAPLLAQARRGVQEARRESDLVERFTGAYLSALRAAAAVLTARGRPHRGRAKPESTWSLLETAAPELAGWAAYFAAFSARHAALQSGVSRGADEESANELVQRAGEFLAIADVLVRGQSGPGGHGAATQCDATVPWPRSRRR
ncbi:SAV_6107 family HEPN domain-containing protein [Prauserella aidingensis]|uniref:SAV_6107 family HEPN domain-containing protein n=1 Tax=Prauserella aidingensis TaxID=387890 RepID=UPI0020A5E7F1|nr:SAV_6107 family HEPN domain-containing protein [Prauserella aidingensis]